jgi:tetratricopeptide (TPR) repeat protein
MNMYGINGIPLEAQYLYRRGVELSGQKKYKAAVKYLRQAIIIAPRFTGAYQELGSCFTRLGREEDAVDCYLKLNRITSHSSCHVAQSST